MYLILNGFHSYKFQYKHHEFFTLLQCLSFDLIRSNWFHCIFMFIGDKNRPTSLLRTANISLFNQFATYAIWVNLNWSTSMKYVCKWSIDIFKRLEILVRSAPPLIVQHTFGRFFDGLLRSFDRLENLIFSYSIFLFELHEPTRIVFFPQLFTFSLNYVTNLPFIHCIYSNSSVITFHCLPLQR